MCGDNARLLVALIIGVCAPWLAEADIVAKVNTDRVSARGRASIFSEVVAQLQQGDRVVVLEMIKHKNPRAGEPADWVKIRMPTNALVWVHRDHVDAAHKVVTGTRLNVRAGPGMNYTIVGSLNQGDTIRQGRVLDDWIQIEAPSNSWAFVNGLFVTLGRSSAENMPDPQERPLARSASQGKASSGPRVPAATERAPRGGEPGDSQEKTQALRADQENP